MTWSCDTLDRPSVPAPALVVGDVRMIGNPARKMIVTRVWLKAGRWVYCWAKAPA